jgi:hypothetical protein
MGTRAETVDTAPVRNGSGGDTTGGAALAGAAAIFTGGTTPGSASIDISSTAKILDRTVCVLLFVRAEILALEVRLGSGKCDIGYSWFAVTPESETTGQQQLKKISGGKIGYWTL